MFNEEFISEDFLNEVLKKQKDSLVKENFALLMEVLDGKYLTSDDYANDCYLRDDVIRAISEILDGSYKEHEACYNCKRKDNCKYKKYCKVNNHFSSSTGNYFQKK